MRPGLQIRRLTAADDLDSFGRIVLDSYVTLADMPREPAYEAELRDVESRVRDGVVFGSFVDGAPAGSVTFVADSSNPHAENLRPGESSFRMLAVATTAQGRGVGDALVRRCIEEARRCDSHALFIYSGTWMHAAHRLYGRLGFALVPERDWIIDPSIHLPGLYREL